MRNNLTIPAIDVNKRSAFRKHDDVLHLTDEYRVSGNFNVFLEATIKSHQGAIKDDTPTRQNSPRANLKATEHGANTEVLGNT